VSGANGRDIRFFLVFGLEEPAQMPDKHFADASGAVLTPLTEPDLAAWLRDRGRKVVCHRGRWWTPTPAGFYHPVHHLARMTAEQATRPTPLCWGFRTTLADNQTHAANATLPVHLLSDVEYYDLQVLSPRRRNKIRNSRKEVAFVEFLAPDLLFDQGYEVVLSAHSRTGYGRLPSREEFRQKIATFFQPRRGLILGGLIDGRLGGFMTGHAVGSTAYVEEVFLHSDDLKSNIGIGLFFEWAQACRRSGKIREMVHGLHAREDDLLCQHKAGLGFTVVHVPARIWFAPLMEKIVRTKRPHAYYRLTGHD
jgi:hypothetical protein